MRQTPFSKLDPLFIDRWSPRSFLENELKEDEILTLFEAARWAPSCYNEQPWLFLFARTREDRQRYAEALVEGNRVWAKRAPILMAVFSRKRFDKNGNENRWADFDTGSAWMSLVLQAMKLGIYCHGMAGFDPEKAYRICNVDPEKYNALCMAAIGRKGPAEVLDEPMRSRESPSDRRPLGEMVFESTFNR